MIKKAVIPAAGFGTRFLPAAKSSPKEMLPIVDTPVIQYVVEEAVNSGITDIVMVIGRGKRAIEEHFDRNFELEGELERKGRAEDLNEIQLTDAMHMLLGSRAMYGYKFKGHRYDAGNKLDYLKTNIAFALKHDDLRNDVVEHIKKPALEL
jgi:UTP-glucose-1-phosphate uridylyltransferase